MADFVVTIDGPAASGKSTAARLLAQRLGAKFLDTGAMYRAVTLAAMRKGVNLEEKQQLLDILERTRFDFTATPDKMNVRIDGVDVTDDIRSRDVTANSRYIAEAPELRRELVRMQRDFAVGRGKIVTEGRDQGTVAFPDADVKFFLTADIETRARRRLKELGDENEVSLEKLVEAIRQRDAKDTQRAEGPLKPAADAVVVDTTGLDIEQMVDVLLEYVKSK